MYRLALANITSVHLLCHMITMFILGSKRAWKIYNYIILQIVIKESV
jgi:hypothetical protein